MDRRSIREKPLALVMTQRLNRVKLLHGKNPPS
jgi:hypothetical protein